MRPVITVLTVAAICCGTVSAIAEDDWPCFLQQDGPKFTAALERDLASSRQRMLTKVLGDLEKDAPDSCPDAARAIADFRRDLTTAFDATISKAIVLDKLRPKWTQRWTAAQCAEVAALATSAKTNAQQAANQPQQEEASSVPEMIARWSRSPQGSAALRDSGLSQRIKETLGEMKSALDMVQLEANIDLAGALPPIIKRDRQVALDAVNACIADEQKRLNTPATPPKPSTPSRRP